MKFLQPSVRIRGLALHHKKQLMPLAFRQWHQLFLGFFSANIQININHRFSLAGRIHSLWEAAICKKVVIQQNPLRCQFVGRDGPIG